MFCNILWKDNRLTLITLVFHPFSLKHSPESHRPTGDGCDNGHWERWRKDWKCVTTILQCFIINLKTCTFPVYSHAGILKINRTGEAPIWCTFILLSGCLHILKRQWDKKTLYENDDFSVYSCTAEVNQCGLTWPITSLSRFMKDEDAFFTQTLSSRLWASSALISNSNLRNIPDDDIHWVKDS